MTKYAVIIYWRDEDGAFVAEVPELPGCAAHGRTQDRALGKAQDAIRLWIDAAREFGDPVPEPKGRSFALGLTLSPAYRRSRMARRHG
jgi:predicted RNase H-like HicB family nuclease